MVCLYSSFVLFVPFLSSFFRNSNIRFLICALYKHRNKRSGVAQRKQGERELEQAGKVFAACPGELNDDRTSFQIVVKLQVREML